MPWGKGDVDRFKKGLGDKQKEKWVATANSVLSDCMKKGGSEKECAAKAVRIANGTVSDNASYTTYNTYLGEDRYSVMEKKLEGRNHFVVPVVMMVEGVHCGSYGPIMHTISELGKFPDAWNGIPVVINHPEMNGMNVSANNPDIIERQSVGRVFNTMVRDNKLSAEAWLDVDKLKNIAPEVFDAIRKKEVMEVSLGVFTDNEWTEGEWNGENYEAIAKNHRPDHLALLPCSVGACSVMDGCGLGANKKGGNIMDSKEEKVVKSLADKAATFEYVSESPPMELNASDENIVSVSDNKTSEVDGDTLVVAESSGFVRTVVNNNQKEEVLEMADKAKECTPCVKEKVNELITNGQGKFTEDDREWLESLDEARLDKLTPTVVEKEIEVNVLSEDDRKAIAAYKQQLKERRENLIKSIQANAKDIWPAEVLNEMDDDKLERLSRSVKKEEVVDYSLNTGFSPNISGTVEPLYPVGFNPNKK